MPRLLDLYDRYGIRATFFFTGHIANLFPEIVKMVIPYGHEIGSHGLTHEVDKAFDILRREKAHSLYELVKDYNVIKWNNF